VLTETQWGGPLNKRGFFCEETETVGKYIGVDWREYQGTYDRIPRSGFAMVLSRHSDNSVPDRSRVDDFALVGQDLVPTHYSRSYGSGEYGQGVVLRYGQTTEDGVSQPGDEIVTGIFFAYVKPQGNPPQDFVRNVKINLYHDPFDRLCSMRRTITPPGGLPEEYKWHYDGLGRKIWANGFFNRDTRYDFTLSFVNDTMGRCLEIHAAGYCSNLDLPIRLVYAGGGTPVYGLEGPYDAEFWCLSDWDGYISRMVTGSSYQELLSQEPEFLVSGGSPVKRLAAQGHPGYAFKEEYLEFTASRASADPGMQLLATLDDLPTIMISRGGRAVVPGIRNTNSVTFSANVDSPGYYCPINLFFAPTEAPQYKLPWGEVTNPVCQVFVLWGHNVDVRAEMEKKIDAWDPPPNATDCCWGQGILGCQVHQIKTCLINEFPEVHMGKIGIGEIYEPGPEGVEVGNQLNGNGRFNPPVHSKDGLDPKDHANRAAIRKWTASGFQLLLQAAWTTAQGEARAICRRAQCGGCDMVLVRFECVSPDRKDADLKKRAKLAPELGYRPVIDEKGNMKLDPTTGKPMQKREQPPCGGQVRVPCAGERE